MFRRIAIASLLLSGCAPVGERRNIQLLQEAERALLLEQHAQAAGLYETFLADNPGDPQRAEIRVQAGKAHLGLGRFDAALRAFDLALNDQPPPPLRWEIHFRRAVAFRMQGEFIRAVESFRVVAAAPAGERGRSVGSDELHYEFALALFRAGDFKSGQVELARVNPRGAYEKKLLPRLGLAGFTVQVGAYGDESTARAEAAKLKGSIRPIAGERPLYLVTSGTFVRYDDALLEADRLKRHGYTDAFVLP